MRFKLLYFGEIFINPKKRSQHISDIRMQFHPQLKKLLEHQPWDNMTQYMMPGATKSPITTRHIGGIDWNPIITPNLKLLAEIDIQMMHPEIVGLPHSDIDNRVKTILDGLRCPQNEHEYDAGYKCPHCRRHIGKPAVYGIKCHWRFIPDYKVQSAKSK